MRECLLCSTLLSLHHAHLRVCVHAGCGPRGDTKLIRSSMRRHASLHRTLRNAQSACSHNTFITYIHTYIHTYTYRERERGRARERERQRDRHLVFSGRGEHH